MYKLPFIILLYLFAGIIVSAQSPHGNGFEIDCSNCHTSENWKVDTQKLDFNHTETGFELIGIHKQTDCKSCHTNLEFSKVKQECFECHTDVHENTLGKDCESCHNSFSWVVASISEIHQMRRFPLLGAHVSADCNQCHISSSNLRYEPLGVECIDCHRNEYNSTQNPNHITAGFSTDCTECHNMNQTVWSFSSFGHDFFPLTGGHAISNCFDCHNNGRFEGLNQDCYSCHKSNYETAQSPNHIELNFPTNCQECHTTNPGWRPAEFTRHNEIYPLLGAHELIKNDCQSCHTNGFENTPNQCFGCHQENYNAASNPSHTQLNFSTDCETCHNTNAWKPASFNHDNEFFPIYSGEHNGEWNNCSDCHVDPNNYARFECINCHEHSQGSMDSEHSGVNGYIYNSEACLSCHPTGSSEGAFNHSSSNFPLIGGHSNQQCADCHSAGYQGTSSECISCHQTNYDQTDNPNHSQLSFSKVCSDCHSVNPGWELTQFTIHNDFYLLTGAHINIANDCANCHEGSYNSSSNRICFDCHSSDFTQTSNPPHQTSGFSNDCESCHNTTAWQPSTFDHDGQYFPIYSGKHNNEWNLCSDCHTNQQDFGLFSCIDCHEHNKTDMDSEHQGVSGYIYESKECFACHPNGDSEGAFNHNNSDFLLTGAHNEVECSSCHINGYLNTSSDCISCHQNNFNQTTNPDHVKLSFGDNCSECHSTDSGWQLTSFTIHDKFYILLGAHQEVQNDCNSCHNSNYNTKFDLCVDCHNADFNNAADPNHIQLSFSNNCDDCHNTNRGWELTSFTIHNQFYVLTGAHSAIANNCVDCHSNGYNNTTDVCYDCHTVDYQTAANPSHAGSSFPTDCETCHTTSAWDPSTFNHDGQYFPIYSGKHNNEWNLCSDCHTNQQDYGIFSCIDCHEHSKSEMDAEHLGEVSNYIYESNACYECHPNGEGDKMMNKARRVK